MKVQQLVQVCCLQLSRDDHLMRIMINTNIIFFFVQWLYVIILSVSRVLSRIEFSAELITTCSLTQSAAILFPPECR